jgi:hypothetical protein
MKKRVYIETTVVSYLVAKTNRDIMVAGHQELTRELWPELSVKYESFISALVYEEAKKGDTEKAQMRLAAIQSFSMLDIDDDARSLAEKLIAGNAISSGYPEDALHIAVAAVNGIEIIITWNFAHINNPVTRILVRKIVESEGYACPEICSPEELLEVDK